MDYFIRADGGIGRCIAATGAIKAFCERTKNKKVNVVTGYPYVFENLEFIDRVYPIGTPFIYEDKIKNGEYLEPEPYNNYHYYNKKEHLSTVFNGLINNDFSFIAPEIKLTNNEKSEAQMFLNNEKKNHGKKIVLVQPWGSQGGKLISDKEIKEDESHRSFTLSFAKNLTEELLKNGFMPYFVRSQDQIGVKGGKTFNNLPIRKIFALMPFVDGVVCCDSFLHHASAALGTPCPTIVLWAGTDEKNLAYEEQMNIRDNEVSEFEPNRIPHDHSHYVKKNKGCNVFSKKTINKILEVLKNNETTKDKKE